MHILQKLYAISGANVVNMYKYSIRNVYITSSEAHALKILPTTMRRALSKA